MSSVLVPRHQDMAEVTVLRLYPSTRLYPSMRLYPSTHLKLEHGWRGGDRPALHLPVAHKMLTWLPSSYKLLEHGWGNGAILG